MALLFCDSFDHYTTAQAARKWSAVSGSATISSVGRNSTNGGNVVGGNAFTWNFPSNLATVVIGLAFKVSSAATAARFLRLFDAGTVQLQLQYNADASLSVLNSANTVLATSAPGVVPSASSQHNYIELKATISDAAGVAVVRVNGVTVINLTSADTKNTANAYVTQFEIGERLSNGNTCQFDDVYVCDTTGLYNNDFMGDVRVEAVFPDGAGNSTQYTPSAGSNFQCVDETPATDDTDYVASSTIGHIDLYTMGNISAASTTVKAVAVNVQSKKTDAGTRTARPLLRSAGSTNNGTTYAPATTYGIAQSIFENIVTTASLQNSMECGAEVIS